MNSNNGGGHETQCVGKVAGEISKPAKGRSRPKRCVGRDAIFIQYQVRERQRDEPGELIAAAHAGCFTMALSGQLGAANLVADQLATTATVTMEKLEAGWTVTGIHLDVKGKVPKADNAAWEKATTAAKTGCPISRLLNTTITMDAKLES